MLAPPNLTGAAQILLGILTFVAAGFDIRYRRIPNWLVLSGIVAGFAWNVYFSGWSGLGHAAAGLGLGFALYWAPLPGPPTAYGSLCWQRFWGE
jgi:Flp pilus assembly protein protease CpaA